MRCPGQEKMATLCLVTPLLIGTSPGTLVLLRSAFDCKGLRKIGYSCLVTPPLKSRNSNPSISVDLAVHSTCTVLVKTERVLMFGCTAFD
jgi:hypothetical protein